MRTPKMQIAPDMVLCYTVTRLFPQHSHLFSFLHLRNRVSYRSVSACEMRADVDLFPECVIYVIF